MKDEKWRLYNPRASAQAPRMAMRKHNLGGIALSGVVGLAALLATACMVPIATDLDEGDANRIIVALEMRGMPAEKTPDAGRDGKWRIQVGRDEASAATTILAAEGLPAKASPGVLEALGDSSLVPSRANEHARFLMGTAAELERSLVSIDGVVSARVHLAVPAPDRLSPDVPTARPTASVLLRYRGAHLPLSEDDVRRLIAGAVTGLAPADIVVVSSAAPGLPPANEHVLRRFGPITVTQASLSLVRAVVGAVAAVNIGLVALILSLWSRVRRERGVPTL